VTPTPRRLGRLAAGLLSLVLVTAACSSGGDNNGDVDAGKLPGAGDIGEVEGEVDRNLKGTVDVTGSSTVEPVSARNAEKFNKLAPNVAISVDGPGTGDGFEIFCNDEADITDASRAIKPEEIEKCRDKGIEFIELKVAIDGNSVITSTENTATECLSFLDLYALIGPESTGFDSWSAANDLAAELEEELGDTYGASHAPYDDVPLVITAPGEESGTYDSFIELAFEDIAEARETNAEARPDYQASPNDNVIVEGISGTPTSLGWVGYAFVAANPDAVRAIAVDGGEGCVEPSPATIASFDFPLSRPLFIYVNKAKAEAKPEVAAYVDFYMSDQGFASVEEVNYVGLTDDEVERTRAAWEERETGTREG